MSKKSWNNGTRELEEIAGAVILTERYDPNDKAYNRTPEEQAAINKKKDTYAKNSKEAYEKKKVELSVRGAKEPSDSSWLARDEEDAEGFAAFVKGTAKLAGKVAYDAADAITDFATDGQLRQAVSDTKDGIEYVKAAYEDAEGETLTDQFMRFANRVSALEEGRPVDVDELRLELNALDEKLEALRA